MLSFLEVLSIAFSIIVFIKAIKLFIMKKNFYCVIPLIIVFDLVMVLPLILEMFIGIPDIPYYNFKKAMLDKTTTYIFSLFILFAEICFYTEIKRINKKIKLSKGSEIYNENQKNMLIFFENMKNKSAIKVMCLLVFLIAIIAIFCAPDSSYYFRIHSVRLNYSSEILNYQYNIMRRIDILLFIAIIMLKLIDKNDRIFDLFTRIVFIILLVFINQKRTLLMICIGTLLAIDLVKGRKIKKIAFKYILGISATAIYFVSYMYITNKISYNNDWYYEVNEYLFRSMHMRFSIYAILNPNEIHILDYPGQSMLFSLLYFIPRSIWHSKPWPYINYFICGVLGYSSFDKIRFHMPPSCFPEFVSNFGLLGIPISIFFIIQCSRFFDRQNGICKMLGLALITLLEIYYYDDMLKIVALIVFILIIKNNLKIKNGKVYFLKRRKNEEIKETIVENKISN